MATLEQAMLAGHVDLYETPDWETRCPIRPLFVTGAFIEWGDNTPELHDERLAIGNRTLFDHLVQSLCDFRCSERLHYGDLKRMMPTKKGIWHFYPPGLRVYGWCPAPHAFVAVCGAIAAETKQNRGLNDLKREQVLEFVRFHKLGQTIKLGDFLALFPHQG